VTQTMAAATPSRRLATAWSPPAHLDHRAWVAVGRTLSQYAKVSNWWVGDWLLVGSQRWGEKYTETAKITGLDAKTLRNVAWVASRFSVSRRRDTLTWSHHAELASLSTSDQDYWLERAATERLSVADLRIEVRAAERASRPDQPDATRVELPDHGPLFVCPQCGHPLDTLLAAHGAPPVLAAAN